MHRKNHFQLMVVVVGLASLLLCVAPFVQASPSQVEDNSSLLPDQRWLSELTGAMPASYESEWAVLTSQIENSMPEVYSGSMIKDGEYYIGFKGSLPDIAKKALAQFPADYKVLTNLGFSRTDIAKISAAIVEIIQRDAPGTVIEIIPAALAPQITLSIDPGSVPDVKMNGEIGQPAIPFTTDPSVTLLSQETQRLQDLASHLGVINDDAIKIRIVAGKWEIPGT